MLIVDRQRRILDYLKTQGSAGLEDLSNRLNVSVSTIRRDLEALQDQGQVQRTHGGVIYLQNALEEGHSITLAERLQQHQEEKRAIGAYAASLVKPHMTVLMDAGSTVLYAAEQITARPIQVVTNSLSIANLYADDEQVELILIGGSLYPRTNCLVGPIAVGCLADLHADLLLFSLAGIYDAEQGGAGYNINLDMAQVEQAMLRQAAYSVMLMDASKFGRKSLVRVCPLEETNLIITDSSIDPTWAERLPQQLVITPN